MQRNEISGCVHTDTAMVRLTLNCVEILTKDDIAPPERGGRGGIETILSVNTLQHLKLTIRLKTGSFILFISQNIYLPHMKLEIPM